MSDRDHGASRSKFRQSLLDLLFRFRIERRRGFVEQEDRRVLQDSACNSEALLLASGKKAALIANHRVVPLWLSHDELVRVSCVCGFVNLLLRRVQLSELNVVKDRVVKQERLLSDEPDVIAQRFLGDQAQVTAIDLYCAGRRIL